jgi:hypothetical protein
VNGPPVGLAFVVLGQPTPQGSKRAVPIYKGPRGQQVFTGKAAVLDQNPHRVRPWRVAITDAARAAMAGHPYGSWGGTTDLMFPILASPIKASMIFTFGRPKSHYRTGASTGHLLSATAPRRPTGPPDTSKLVRLAEDAITDAGLWRDDSLVVEYGRLAKVYVGEDPDALDTPGVLIRIWWSGWGPVS